MRGNCSIPDCDNPATAYSGYCQPCHNEYQRLNRHNWPSTKRKGTPEYEARYKANNARRDGILIPEPCEVCGNEKVQMHHEDYEKPLDVTWLCKKCHQNHHNQQKKA